MTQPYIQGWFVQYDPNTRTITQLQSTHPYDYLAPKHAHPLYSVVKLESNIQSRAFSYFIITKTLEKSEKATKQLNPIETPFQNEIERAKHLTQFQHHYKQLNTPQYNPQQQSIITSSEPVLSIIAGAGTGKTHTITERIKHLIQQGIKAENILAITFTNKAANELKERLKQKVTHADIKAKTFHSLCAEILRTYLPTEKNNTTSYTQNFTILPQEDVEYLIHTNFYQENINQLIPELTPHYYYKRWSDYNIIRYTLYDYIPYKKSHNSPPHPISIKCAENNEWKTLVKEYKTIKTDTPSQIITQIAKDWHYTLTDPNTHDWLLKQLISDYLYARYTIECREQNLMDFNDLINQTTQLLEQHDTIKNTLHTQYTHLFVDEFQDTSHNQYLLLKQLISDKNPNICIVGDDDQSIYGWMAAQPTNILKFEKDYQATRYYLTENYRSSANILKFANQTIQLNNQRNVKQLQVNHKTNLSIITTKPRSEHELYQNLIKSIQLQKTQRPQLNWSDIAILVRHHQDAKKAQEACQRANIPHYVKQRIERQIAPNVQDLSYTLELWRNPHNLIALEHVLKQQQIGILSERSIQHIIKWIKTYNKNWENDQIPQHTPHHTVEKIPTEIQIPEKERLAFERFQTHWNTKRKQYEKETNLLTVIQNIALAFHNLTNEDDTTIPNDTLDFSTYLAHLNHYITYTQKNYQTPSLSEWLDTFKTLIEMTEQTDNAVQILTIHSAKGLEFPFVHLIEWATTPYKKDLLDPAQFQNEQEKHQEEVRLAYVGITRAKEQLHFYQHPSLEKSLYFSPLVQN